MNHSLLVPPIAFLILFGTILFFSFIFSKWSFRKVGASEESKKAYACGENFSGNQIQPDYSQFFPFAFFFTILHVVAMVIATTPIGTLESFAVPMIYIAGAITGLLILLRK